MRAFANDRDADTDDDPDADSDADAVRVTSERDVAARACGRDVRCGVCEPRQLHVC